MSKTLQDILNQMNKLTESVLNEAENDLGQKYYIKIYQDWDTDEEIKIDKHWRDWFQEHRVFYVAKSYDIENIEYTYDFSKAKAYTSKEEAEYIQRAVYNDDRGLKTHFSSNLGKEYYDYRVVIIDQNEHEISSFDKPYNIDKKILVNVVVEIDLIDGKKEKLYLDKNLDFDHLAKDGIIPVEFGQYYNREGKNYIDRLTQNLFNPAGYGTVDFLTNNKNDALIIQYPKYNDNVKKFDIDKFCSNVEKCYSGIDGFKNVKVYTENI